MKPKDRSAFEEWVRQNFDEFDLSRYPEKMSSYGNEYIMNKIHSMWIGWCGATGQDPNQP